METTELIDINSRETEGQKSMAAVFHRSPTEVFTGVNTFNFVLYKWLLKKKKKAYNNVNFTFTTNLKFKALQLYTIELSASKKTINVLGNLTSLSYQYYLPHKEQRQSKKWNIYTVVSLNLKHPAEFSSSQLQKVSLQLELP